MAARSGRCWYCGEARLADGDPPEHVVPSAIGGELTTNRVCQSCNTLAGRLIDAPLLRDWFVAWERKLWDIRDIRHRDRPPPFPEEELTLPGGTRVRWREDMTLEVIPTVASEGDKRNIVTGSDAEAEEIIGKITERAARDGKKLTPGQVRRELAHEIVGKLQVSGLVWLRATTKMAVATASLVLDESWLDTEQAAKYREFLWAEKPMICEGEHAALPYPNPQPELMNDVVQPPNHLVVTVPGRDRVVISTVLFGNLSAGSVEFEIDGSPPQDAWLLDPVEREVHATTFTELAERAAIRKIERSRATNVDPDEA